MQYFRKINSLRLVKPRKGGPGDRLGSILVLGFVQLFLHLSKPKGPSKRRTTKPKNKPKTNEQTLGFLVKTRMEYKRRIHA